MTQMMRVRPSVMQETDEHYRLLSAMIITCYTLYTSILISFTVL